MPELLLPLFLALLLGYALTSARTHGTVLTAPIVFTAGGFLAALAVPELAEFHPDRGITLHLAELGLVLVLFTDASRTDLGVLRSIQNLPTRLLSAGLLLTLAAGAAVAKLVFPSLSLWEAAILSCILAPTDAGLGQAIVESPRLPLALRQALNVEAGLNDGLCVPFMMFSMALAVQTAGTPSLARLIYEQLALGALLGLGIGLVGGGLLALADRNGWTERPELALVTLPLLAMLASERAGASMFIAAFVAGLAVQWGFHKAGRSASEFAEEWGQLLNWLVFFLFGAAVVHRWHEFSPSVWVYAVLSLTVIRMLPVAVALWGTGTSRTDVLFMGWFGPRGLASIVLGLVYLESAINLPGEGLLANTVACTVVLSIVAHGLSASPAIAWYAGGAKST